MFRTKAGSNIPDEILADLSKVASLTEKSAAIFNTPFRHSFRRETNELYIHSATVRKPLILVAYTHTIIINNYSTSARWI